MTITVGWWAIPAVLSAYFVYRVFKGNERDPWAAVVQCLWAIPALAVWVIYLAIERIMQ